MMAMMTGEGGRRRTESCWIPPSEGCERSSGVEECHAARWRRLALQKHIQTEKKTNKKINLGRGEVPPGGTFRPGKVPTPVLPSPERWDHCAGHVPSSHFSADSARS